MKCPNCNHELKEIKGTVKIAAQIGETKRSRNDILRDIRYEESPGEHTFHMCNCGRKGCRSNKCLICLREEFNGTSEKDENTQHKEVKE